MDFAVFYRNLNLGRANAPTKDQLERAYLEAGAESAASFQVNGTIAFSVGGRRSPKRVVERAAQSLERACGLVEPGFLRPMADLAALVARDPFARIARESVYARCVSFLDPLDEPLPATPLLSARGDVEVIELTATYALSTSRKVGASPGSPNAFLEKRFAVAATTRVYETVAKLVAKHG